MKKYICIASPLVFLLSLILIYTVRTIPKGQIWKDYTVIYVDKDSDNQKIMQAFDSLDIKNVVSLYTQYLPVNLSENSIEYSMLRINYEDSEFDYLNKRRSFFYDKANSYRLYYIPSEYKTKVSDCLHLINAQGINCGTDANSTYPVIIPIIITLLCIILLLFVKNKLPFIFGLIVPVFYLFCNPFYPVALATCLIILCDFFVANIWKRRNIIQKIKANLFLLIMPFVSLICSFSVSVICGLLFILAALGTAGCLFSLYFMQDYIRNKKSFVPVYIRSAKRVSIFAGKAFITMSSLCAGAVLLIAVLFLTSSDSFQSKVSKLLLPASSSIKNENLPQFEDYYRWVWNVKTYPYQSINNASSQEMPDSDVVEFPEYIENTESGIIEVHNSVMSYDKAFKKSVYDDIESLKFDSAEKVMKSEGADFVAGYSSTGGNQINLFGIIMSFICLFVLLFIYFSIIIRKGIVK